ncbi:MAG: hypothetical protein HY290_24755 [Planctomycetia bacterium]|nr:hypothetical protein [Planctomycetia bacterium]
MTAKDIVAELKKFATAQTKKTWMTHGAQEPCFGVKVEDMKKIQKRVKMDYQLALDLYDTGIADACHVKPLHKLAVDTAHGIGKVAVDLVGACKIPFAPDHIKKFEARSAIGKKRKLPKC